MKDNKREFEDIEMSLSEKDDKRKRKPKKKGENSHIIEGQAEKNPSKFVQKWKSLDKWKRITIIVVCCVVLLALVAGGVVYGIYNGFRTDIDEENLGISTEIQDKYGKTDIFNIAVFGLDTRDENSFSGRSDSIIIVSVDKSSGTVKLTSILRDSYVSIDGHEDQKITHAYAFGGAELAIKTINQNFHMNITDYATINFYKLAEAIDVLGGIDIEITESEMKQINAIGDDEGKVIDLVKDYGEVHLNGDQAAVYVRLRENDSDVVRSQRQKNVINALIDQARKVSPAKYGEVVKTMMSLCETSLSASEVMSFAPMINMDLNIQTLTIPGDEENAIGGIYNGAWVWRYDLDAASERIHMFIYGEVPVFESTTSKKKPVTTKKSSTTRATNTTGNKVEPSSRGDSSITTTIPAGTTANTTTTTTLPANTTNPSETTSGSNEENTDN